MALAASSPLHAVPPAPALHTPPEKRGGTPSTGCTAGRHSVAHPSRWSGPPPSQHDSTSGDQVLGSQRPAVPAVQHDSDSTSGPRLRAFCCAGSSVLLSTAPRVQEDVYSKFWEGKSFLEDLPLNQKETLCNQQLWKLHVLHQL
ncbi:aldehyde dehydrogenase family 7 member A1-like isoform X1 [Zea mays]|uniref:aldehyde dehydrogenase family 7 member A1-like isoform X1 n=1 Tax=Zea mays TaxID=4577 RepID=UPI0016524A05|nr:aldehyde dehydrogenase family 7 member A1-like isoform X1 [Zea mays]